MAFDFLSENIPGDPAKTRARREQMAQRTVRVVGYDEAKRILEGAVGASCGPWEQSFFDALEKCRDTPILAGKVEADVDFLVGVGIGKGVWFQRSESGVAKGMVPEKRVPVFVEIARKKGLL